MKKHICDVTQQFICLDEYTAIVKDMVTPFAFYARHVFNVLNVFFERFYYRNVKTNATQVVHLHFASFATLFKTDATWQNCNIAEYYVILH